MKPQKYNGRISSNLDQYSKWMDVETKSTNFKPSDPINMLSLLHNFKTACDRNLIHKGAAMWIFQHFIKDTPKAALAHRVSATKKDVPEQEEQLTTYCQSVS